MPERGDVCDERVDLHRPEQAPRAARLQADALERHVARAEIEVRRARADAAERRRDTLVARAHPIRAVARGPGSSAVTGRVPAAQRRPRARRSRGRAGSTKASTTRSSRVASCLVTRPVDDRRERGEQDDHQEDDVARGAMLMRRSAGARVAAAPPPRRRASRGRRPPRPRTASRRATQATAASAACTVSCGMPKRALAGLQTAADVADSGEELANHAGPPQGSRTTGGRRAAAGSQRRPRAGVSVTTSVIALTACQ